MRTLGAVELADGDGSCRALLAQPKRFALFAYLAMAADDRFSRRDALLTLFWPESPASQARAALRQSVRFLRSTLGADIIEARGAEELRLTPGVVWHDVAAFRTAARTGAHADALDLYRGDFLAGFFVANGGTELEEWISHERASLRRTAIESVTALATEHEEAERLDDAVRMARRGVALDPLHEPLHRQLMILLDALGDRAGALEAYDTLAQRLAREFDAAPSPDTRNLRDRIHKRGARPVARTPALAEDAPIIGPTDKGQALVVLPLAGRDAHEVALGSGMAEMVHTVLQGAPGLVLAPIASESLAERIRRDQDARRRLLGGSMLLDGSVERADDGLVVQVRIADGDGRVQWQERFARPARELFALQDGMTRAIAAALHVRLATSDEPRLRRPTHDLEAYNLYVRGRWHWTRRPRETRRALEFLERAIARDPLFALAHSAIADAYNTLGSWEASELPAWETFPRAHAAARLALDLQPGLAEGLTALGYAEMHYTWRRDVAERHLREAVAAAPTYGHAHHWHSHLLLAGGQVAESLVASESALSCDPIDPVLNVHLAWHHWLAREPDEAIAQCARTLEMHPADHWSPYFAGLSESFAGRADNAVSELRRAVDRGGGSPVMASALAYALATRGDTREAREMLGVLERTAEEKRLLAYEVALVHLALGERDTALTWLDRAYEERSAWLAYAAVEPRLDPLRGDERFASLLRALRVPSSAS
jgi:DNA-binding SARP family transcriptional activator/TolB-like protein/Tfp pilus assembly protein PilF